jgi:hypothetical protein
VIKLADIEVGKSYVYVELTGFQHHESIVVVERKSDSSVWLKDWRQPLRATKDGHIRALRELTPAVLDRMEQQRRRVEVLGVVHGIDQVFRRGNTKISAEVEQLLRDALKFLREDNKPG